VQIGPYSVLGEVARGGHGVVYRAQDDAGQQVALKLLLAHRAQNQQARQRFQAEVNALTRLRHPHVVPILGAGEHEGCPWMALEYVEGESLEARLRRGPLSIHEAIRVAQQLALALSYVHGCGVVHRDLKPDNVLLRGDQALLTDFGLVLDDQRDASRITASGAFQGTPGYWAPEQAEGETRAHGPATDVYGLGAVLYACLTGHPPVQARSLQEHLQADRFRSTPAPHTLRPEVPAWLSELCMSCLALLPAARPATAEELGRALLLARGPLSAANERARGHGGWWVGLGALTLIAGLGLTWSLWPEDEPSAAELATQPEDGPPPSPSGERSRADQARERAEEAARKASEGRHAEAIEELDEALELDPNDAVAYTDRGFSRFQLGRHAEAIEDCDRALQLDPYATFGYLTRGMAKAELGRYVEAIADYDEVLLLEPNNLLAYRNRGHSRGKLGRDAEAIEDYDRVLQLNPNDVRALASRGTCKAKLGRHAEAIEDFDRALLLDPNDAFAYANRGANKGKLGRYAEAAEDYAKAVELDPDNVLLHLNLGLCKNTLGRYAEALDDFDRALQLDPNNPTAYAHRGIGKAELERFAEAIADFDQALALGLPARTAAQVRAAREEVLGLLEQNGSE